MLSKKGCRTLFLSCFISMGFPLQLFAAYAAEQSLPMPGALLEEKQSLFQDLPTTLSLGLGSSLPDDLKARSLTQDAGPSRNPGGEILEITFKDPRVLSSVKLSAFSKSHKGRVLIHRAEAVVVDQGKDVKIALGELFDFNQKAPGLYDTYNNLVMLNDNGWVQTSPNREIKSVRLQVEGFSNDDASLAIAVSSPVAFNYYDFAFHRPGSGSTLPDSGHDNTNPIVLADGYYSCGPNWSDVRIVRDGQFLYVQNTQATGAYTMRCDWTRSQCVLIEANERMCAGYTFHVMSRGRYSWHNNCRGYSGACTWVGY